MGVDLTGMTPQGATPEPRWGGEDPWIKKNGSDSQFEMNPQIKEEYDDFMRSKIEWQDANDGAYFRNNVWSWRPLWHFVTSMCGDILTDKDIERGNYNDGHKISKTKAKRIATRLRKMLKNGDIASYESAYARHNEGLEETDWNKNYPFSIQNVREFERFCANSGGFEIW